MSEAPRDAVVAARAAAEISAELCRTLPGASLVSVLKSDRYAATAKVLLADGRCAVWKRSVVVVPPGIRVAPAARRLARREADHLARFAGLVGVPGLLFRPSPDTILREWIDGETLRDTDPVPDSVFPLLRVLLDQVHARGVAYADLAKEENVIVDGSGRPWLVDFQISVARDTFAGALLKTLQRADRVHLARHVARRRPDQLTAADRETLLAGKGLLNRLHRTLVKKPYNVVTRHLVTRWSGAGEGRRADEPRG